MGDLLIRADADEFMGTGHVMRCLALAQAWQDAGAGTASLASIVLPPGIRARFEREGVRVLSVGGGGEALSQAVRESGASWTVLDGYQFGAEEQQAVTGSSGRLLVVDDFGAVGHYVGDMIVDPNVLAGELAYARRPPGTRLLLGPTYALLRRELRSGPAPSTVARGGRRVLLTFGGADRCGLSLLALEALGAADIEVTVVVGPANPRRSAVQAAAEGHANVRVVSDAADMRDLIDGADMAVTAAGGTCMELAYRGVPQIVVVTARNQRHVAEGLAQRGAASTLGEGADLTADRMRDAVLTLLGDGPERLRLRDAGMQLVDGNGADRVIAAMREVAA